MSKSNPTTAIAKKHQVFVGAELKAESNNYEDVIPKIHELQNDNVAEIKVVNNIYKVTRLYIKGRYDKNYRIVDTEYVAPSKGVSEETAAE